MGWKFNLVKVGFRNFHPGSKVQSGAVSSHYTTLGVGLWGGGGHLHITCYVTGARWSHGGVETVYGRRQKLELELCLIHDMASALCCSHYTPIP